MHRRAAWPSISRLSTHPGSSPLPCRHQGYAAGAGIRARPQGITDCPCRRVWATTVPCSPSGNAPRWITASGGCPPSTFSHRFRWISRPKRLHQFLPAGRNQILIGRQRWPFDGLPRRRWNLKSLPTGRQALPERACGFDSHAWAHHDLSGGRVSLSPGRTAIRRSAIRCQTASPESGRRSGRRRWARRKR